jgi:hypothetical protein
MRASAVAIALIALSVYGQPVRPGGGIRGQGSNKSPAVLRLLPGGPAASLVCGGQTAGSWGETVSLARTTPRGCNCGGGSYEVESTGVPCVEPTGLSVWAAHTNLVQRSQELDTTWTATNATVGTADAQVAPDGTSTAETVATSAAGGYIESNAFAIASTSAVAGIFAKTTSGSVTGALVLRDTTAGADKCTATVSATTSYPTVPFSCSATTVSGNTHVLRFYPGGAAGEGTLVGWGAMAYAGATVLPPYCPTTSASATCNQDIFALPKPAAFSESEGCSKICFTPSWTGAPTVTRPYLNGGVFEASLLYNNSGGATMCSYNGTNAACVAVAYVAGSRICARTSWSVARNVLRVENLTTNASGQSAFANPYANFAATMSLGRDTLGRSIDSTVDSIEFGSSPDGCR